MKKALFSLTLILFLSGFSRIPQGEKNEHNLSIHVSGFTCNNGQALLQLFRITDKVPTKPFMVVKASIANKETSFSVDNIPYGDYAAIILHDENSNNMVDHSWGIPSEPLGFSNNWSLSLFSGMPSFEKLRFTYSGTNYSFSIMMEK
jgi:uncharacterized protein (DUF2141 family)